MIQYSFFFSSRRRHTRSKRDWSSDVCSSDLLDLTIQVHDPHVTCEQIPMLQPFDHLKKAEIVILAVPHDAYDGKRLATLLKDRGVLMDIKDVIPATALPENITKWTL